MNLSVIAFVVMGVVTIVLFAAIILADMKFKSPKPGAPEDLTNEKPECQPRR